MTVTAVRDSADDKWENIPLHSQRERTASCLIRCPKGNGALGS